jgi:hypothetical protein
VAHVVDGAHALHPARREGQGVSAPAFKTVAEQKLDWITSLRRPLSEDESDELRRSLHAKYVRDWRLARLARTEREMNAAALAAHARENAETLELVLLEARL